MTKDEIKKALEMCAGNCFRICCPYGTAIGDCCGKLKKDALDLITDQEREIEQLKAENEELTKVMSSKVYDFVNKIIDETNTRLEIEKQAKIDVLNELKEKIQITKLNDDTALIIIEMIEELKQ